MIVIGTDHSLIDTGLSAGGVPLNANNPLIGWRNILTPFNVETDLAEVLFPAANLANPSTHLYWVSTATVFQSIQVNNDDFETVDYVAIAGHNFGSSGCTVQIQTATELDSMGDYDWTEASIAVIPADDTPLLFRITSGQYLAIRIALMPNTDEPPRAAVVYMGELLVCERRMFVGHRPLTYNSMANVITGLSETGIFLGRILLGEFLTSQLDFKNITPEFFREDLDLFRVHAKTRPFFFAWRPNSFPREVGYAWAMGNMNVSNALSNGLMGASMPIQGIFE